MSDSNIFQWPPIVIDEHFIEFVQGLQTFYDMTKYCVLPIQIINVVCKGDEKLATAATLLSI